MNCSGCRDCLGWPSGLQ
ncbi:hypothetical protein GWK36_10545 [Caldichromatium japonicum]|uniref:Uncharacterized protein n=1 Tax=Caldichromatium japonicum TaxID=2699430 RepID=A0A6G7VGM4_9GAMM|nr:hypothetical protein GWK36_10545 [Caldichromatium japonicum]